MKAVVGILTEGIWSPKDNLNSKIDYLNFLNGENMNKNKLSSDIETIDINTANCENANDYFNMVNHTDMILMNKYSDDNSYI